MLNAFAGLAAFGFLAAYLVPATLMPAGAALAEGVSESRFDTAQADAQMYVAAADLAPAGSLQYGNYAVSLQAQADGAPHPKAPVEEWLAYAQAQGVDVPDGATREDIARLVAEAEAEAEAEKESAAGEDETQEAESSASEPASAEATLQTPFYTGGGQPEEWMAAAGIAKSDWGYVDYIVSRESGWNPNATNASSGACGLVQALPCSKVPGGGYNPVANLKWATGYATGRYGSWAGAYAFWTANHWW